MKSLNRNDWCKKIIHCPRKSFLVIIFIAPVSCARFEHSEQDIGSKNGNGIMDSSSSSGISSFDDGGLLKICDQNNFDVDMEKADWLVVLDRSNSMVVGGYWSPMTESIKILSMQMKQYINFGLMVFPSLQCTNTDVNTGCAVPSTPTVPLDSSDAVGMITQKLDAATGVGTCGGTPLAKTLTSALNYLKTIKDSKKKYVLLATDGAPNCSANSPDPETCTCTYIPSTTGPPVDSDSPPQACDPINCLDDQGATAAAKALSNAGYPLYVLGIGDLSRWQQVLNQIAQAGGTPQYYSAEETSKFLPILQSTVGSVISCNFKLDWQSLDSSASKNPALVNIYCKENPTDPPNMSSVIKHNPQCQGGKGWDWIDTDTISLCPGSCDDIKAGTCKMITATFGCNTVDIQ